MTKKPDRDHDPTDADAIAAISAMQARYDKALEEYGRAKARAKLLREAARELADELFDFNRKLNERMPLYEPHVTQPAPAAARSLPKPA